MVNENYAGVCGLYCGVCEYREDSFCEGCMAIQGRPSWVEHVGMDACPLYSCCVVDRKLEHCGMCDDLPCDLFLRSHDPSLNADEARADIRNREITLRRRGHIGTHGWIKEQHDRQFPQ